MAVLLSTRTLRDSPNGNPISVLPPGTRLNPGARHGPWLEVTVVDPPGTTGWLSAEAVKQDADTIGPLDKQAFADVCNFQGSVFGVSAHYLAAVATLRTNVTDETAPEASGPFAFTKAEWDLNSNQPAFQLDAAGAIGSWRVQVAVFAIMTRLAQQRLAALLGSQPNAAELYLSQLIGSKAAAAALQDKAAGIAAMVGGLDAAALRAEGIDAASLGNRDAKLLGAGTVEGALNAITEALDAALTASRPFVVKAGDQPLADAAVTLAADGPAGGRINFDSPHVPAARRDMAQLVVRRFAEAGYGFIQQVAALANAIAESGLRADARSPPPEQSFGLFQLNLKGVGHGHEETELVEPERNIAIMLAHIATLSANAAFKATSSVNDAVAIFVRDFEKPADATAAINVRVAIAKTLLV
ncbi:MAG: hypothetical protein ACTHLT_04290 [Devosia sp.]